MRKYRLMLPPLVLQLLVAAALAQTPAASQTATPDRVLGEVTAIDAAARSLTINAQGKQVLVKLDEKAVFRRVPPGEKTLDKAVEIKLEEVGVGDRVLARGAAGEAKDVLLGRVVIVMSKEDITQKRERDRAEWLRRGITGVVSAVSPETKEVTLLTRSPGGNQTVVVATDGARFRRYAPDSVNFSDARASSLAELKAGDLLRALGERGADGTRYKAEEVVSAALRTISGTVVSPVGAGAELTVRDVKTKQPLTVVVAKNSVVRRFTPELVKMLEQGASGGAGQAGGDLQNMIESLPPLAVADLKPGDAVLITSGSGAGASRVTAVLIAAGVEELVRQQEKAAVPKEFNLGLGLPTGAIP